MGLGPRLPGALFATFDSGASTDVQSPDLNCQVFVFNQIFHRDGKIASYPKGSGGQMADFAQRRYDVMNGLLLRNEFGLTEEVQKDGNHISGVPSIINFSCVRWKERADAWDRKGRREFLFVTNGEYDVGMYLPFKSHQLFKAWGEMATQAGWGPKEAQQLLQDSKKKLMSECWTTRWKSKVNRHRQVSQQNKQRAQNSLSEDVENLRPTRLRQDKDNGPTHSL